MKEFLIKLIAKYEPLPARRDLIEGMINAGEEGVAVEIIAENCYDNHVCLTAEESAALKTVAEELHLSRDYVDMIAKLPVAPSDLE